MSDTNKSVTLFIQCLVDGIYPEVGEAMVRIFRKLGINLICPTKQTCCGQPAFNAGYRREAGVAAKRFIDIFETAEVIVCPSGSCVTMVRHHYPLLFGEDGPWQQRARQVAAKTYKLTEYLVDILGVEDIMTVRLPIMTHAIYCAIFVSKRNPASFWPRFPVPNLLKCTTPTGAVDSVDHFP